MNARRSVLSAISFDVGLPCPCPAAVSTRSSTGAAPTWAACSAAANLNE